MYKPKDTNFDLVIRDEKSAKNFYELERIEKTKVVCEGFWRGRHFVIGKNHFSVPVIYVEWKGTEPPGDEYFGKAYWLPAEERGETMYYGWDHGHAWDWIPMDFNPVYRWQIPTEEEYAKEHHKWSIPEMLMEIVEWIEWNKEYENSQIEDRIKWDME